MSALSFLCFHSLLLTCVYISFIFNTWFLCRKRLKAFIHFVRFTFFKNYDNVLWKSTYIWPCDLQHTGSTWACVGSKVNPFTLCSPKPPTEASHTCAGTWPSDTWTDETSANQHLKYQWSSFSYVAWFEKF